MSKDGMKALADALKEEAFPKAESDAKELYREGQKTRGILSRQHGEPMVSFETRRKRWWRILKEMDPSIELSTSIRGDLLLDAANLDKWERLMVLTSANNVRTFEAIARALRDQHPKKHQEEKEAGRKRTDDDRPKGRGKGGWKRKGWRRAHMTYGSPEEDEEYAEEEDGYEDWWQEEDPEEEWRKEEYLEEAYSNTGHPQTGEEEEYDPEGEDLDEALTSYLLDSGMTDEAQIASLVQENYVAHLNWTTKTKGKSPWRFRKGKGKG